MTETQKELLLALKDCGLTNPALMFVGAMTRSEAIQAELLRRVIRRMDLGDEVNDSMVLNELTSMMKEASETI